jgi:surfeit locus 1 family protein
VLLHQASTLVIQRIDMKDIQRETHQAFYPFILRLNKADPHGFVRDWTITTVEPARHVGYAVQWFAMALTLLIAYFCFCIERVKHATV